MSLLTRISAFENLWESFSEIARKKKASPSVQRFLYNTGEQLLGIEADLNAGRYKWGRYREVSISTGKARSVFVPCLRDRIVQTAIYRVLNPFLEGRLLPISYACRIGYGNSRAVLDVLDRLKNIGPQRFVIKLDVEKYYENIPHDQLLHSISKVFQDAALTSLIRSLLDSHPNYRAAKCGLPVGLVTSQMLANWYLHDLDQAMSAAHGFGSYFRYMDDLLVVASNRECAHTILNQILDHTERLGLKIPEHKRFYLGSEPVPFLGFVLSHQGYVVNPRNEARHRERVADLLEKRSPPSRILRSKLSYESWTRLKYKT